MKLQTVLVWAAPVAVLACGPFFYPAPPTLSQYPERLPVKTMSELLREAKPQAPDAATLDQMAEETMAIGRDLHAVPRDEMLRRIDTALARNRSGDYRKRFGNCLYDFRDLLFVNGHAPAEAATYIAWRLEAMEWDDGFFSKRPGEYAARDAAQLAKMRAEHQERYDATASYLNQESSKSAQSLKPHWVVQAGAWQFKHAHFSEAARLFESVIAESPGHPRAEVARLMVARTRIEEWRAVMTSAGKGISAEKEYDAAVSALEAYVTAHPTGRFAPDIPGWRGGLAREQGSVVDAIRFFLQQMDYEEHPEIVRGAVRQLELCLDALSHSDEHAGSFRRDPHSALPWDEIARRPAAAMAVVYHFLDTASRRDFGTIVERYEGARGEVVAGLFTHMLRVRRAGRLALPALAEAVAKQRGKYAAGLWRPKYLAILAWASSEVGEHRQAVAVADLAGAALDTSDDLLFVRTVALQRAGDLDAAIAGFQALQLKFPASPLGLETGFRIATALRDKGEHGLAVVELFRIRIRGMEQQEAAVSLHLPSEIDQWIDTLLQFANPAALERGLAVANLEPEIASRLRGILRTRSLARGAFAEAARFAEPEAALPEEDAAPGEPPPVKVFHPTFDRGLSELTGGAWHIVMERLQTAPAGGLPPMELAEKLFAQAEHWSAARGHLTLPSLEDYGIFNSEFYQSWRLRSRNAESAGFAPAAVSAELETRDELHHAQRLYMQAAEAAPGTPVAARALWQANDTIRKIAELSPWTAGRAFQTNASERSRLIHERLLRENPDSPEARHLSVWWTFPPPGEHVWLPGDRPNHRAEVALAEVFGNQAREIDDSVHWTGPDRSFGERLHTVVTNAGVWETARLTEELAAIRRDFLPHFSSARGADLINDLDDLTLFLSEPGLTPAARSRYFQLRMNEGPPDVDDPDLQPWRDYLAFMALVREPPAAPGAAQEGQKSRAMSERMREFLQAYPKSKKREAALARLAIATVREARGRTRVESTEWPESPKLGGYKRIASKGGGVFDKAKVFGVLEEYEREFPNGRYLAVIRMWRGAAAINAGDWKAAVDLLVATLDDQSQRDLHLDASLHLADVYMRLLEQPETRPGIIAAIASNRSAQRRLGQFMYSDTLGARLRCMEGFLRERMGVTFADR